MSVKLQIVPQNIRFHPTTKIGNLKWVANSPIPTKMGYHWFYWFSHLVSCGFPFEQGSKEAVLQIICIIYIYIHITYMCTYIYTIDYTCFPGLRSPLMCGVYLPTTSPTPNPGNDNLQDCGLQHALKDPGSPVLDHGSAQTHCRKTTSLGKAGSALPC